MRQAIFTEGLSRTYGATRALDGVSLAVPRGQVFGLLGPNGAGKSTTLRMLVNLVRPSSGEIEVLGAKPGGSLDRIGTLIEDPALYPHLTGRQHLAVLADLSGVDHARIAEVLDMVGLHQGVDRDTSSYSTGMRQRLGLAAALLDDPELLILDEPSAGLDPEGVTEVRDLLRRLGDGHRTVLLSSHLLPEVDQVCDHLGVLLGGELAYQGAMVDLVSGDTQVVVRAEPADRAAAIVAEVLHCEPDHREGELVGTGDHSDVPELTRRLADGGVDVSGITTRARSLEEAYLELTRAAS